MNLIIKLKGADNSLLNLSGYRNEIQQQTLNTPTQVEVFNRRASNKNCFLFKTTCGLLEDLFFLPHCSDSHPVGETPSSWICGVYWRSRPLHWLSFQFPKNSEDSQLSMMNLKIIQKIFMGWQGEQNPICKAYFSLPQRCKC